MKLEEVKKILEEVDQVIKAATSPQLPKFIVSGGQAVSTTLYSKMYTGKFVLRMFEGKVLVCDRTKNTIL